MSSVELCSTCGKRPRSLEPNRYGVRNSDGTWPGYESCAPCLRAACERYGLEPFGQPQRGQLELPF